MLEQKEPKIQDKPDPSGRFVGPLRAWVATLQTTLHELSLILSNLKYTLLNVLRQAQHDKPQTLQVETVGTKKVIIIKVATQARWAECRPEAIRHS